MNVHSLPVRTEPVDVARARDLLSLREVVTLAEIPEKRVRKDIETGVLASPRVWRLHDARLCFPWESVFTLAAVYSNRVLTGGMRRSTLNRLHDWSSNFHELNTLNNYDTRVLYMGCSKHPSYGPPLFEIDRYVKINLTEVCESLLPKVSNYMRGLRGVEEKPDILGGDAVFKDTRLSVYHVGKMLENGESRANILEDYSYLTEADLEFAIIYCRAHPPVGRPRTSEEPGDDAKTRIG